MLFRSGSGSGDNLRFADVEIGMGAGAGAGGGTKGKLKPTEPPSARMMSLARFFLSALAGVRRVTGNLPLAGCGRGVVATPAWPAIAAFVAARSGCAYPVVATPPD